MVVVQWVCKLVRRDQQWSVYHVCKYSVLCEKTEEEDREGGEREGEPE